MFDTNVTYGSGIYYLDIDAWGNYGYIRTPNSGHYVNNQDMQNNFESVKLYKELVRSYGLAKLQRNKTEMARLEKRLKVCRYANL